MNFKLFLHLSPLGWRGIAITEVGCGVGLIIA